MSSNLDDYGFYPLENLLNSQLQVFLLLFVGASEFTPDRFDGYVHPAQLSWTISIKIKKMEYAYDDFFEQVQTWRKIPQLIEEQGLNALGEKIHLELRYETYLNTIYSLCDSLGAIARGVLQREHRLKGHSKITMGFNRQRDYELNHRADNPYGPYGRLLASIDWYEDFHQVRTEATHNLSGFVTNWTEGIPGYFNLVKIEKKTKVSEVEIENIIEHVEGLQVKVKEFLEAFGSIFLEVINPETSREVWCLHKLSTNQIFTRTISPRNCQGSQKGTCSSLGLECPGQDRCLVTNAATSDPKAT